MKKELANSGLGFCWTYMVKRQYSRRVAILTKAFLKQ